jgi:hypothetical protein
VSLLSKQTCWFLNWGNIMKMTYQTNCVSSNGSSITKMVESSKEITFSTFSQHCDYKELATSLGYAFGNQKGLHLQDDYHVRFFKSKFNGKKCCFVVQSAIEYIFY